MNTNEWILDMFKVAPGRPCEIPGINRDTLAEVFARLGFDKGAEIGVEKGKFAEVLCKANPNLQLTCVDPWQHYAGYRDSIDNLELEGFYQQTQERLKGFNVTFLRMTSVEAAQQIEDKSLDFVYIDANHEFQYVAQDLALWTPKVKAGGIIAGHDYMVYEKTRHTPLHVIYVVKAWTEAYHINPWFVAGSKEKPPGVLRDRVRSWFWVKP